MEDHFCTDCKSYTLVVTDHSSGDVICTECALVLESHTIDETSEWRIFADESGDTDPNRVGAASNPLLPDGGLSTVISKNSKGERGDALASSLTRLQNRSPMNNERSLLTAFSKIKGMADRLALVTTAKDRACEIYRDVDALKTSRGRNQDAILGACLFIACREEDIPRTVKEICSVSGKACKKDIGRAREYIVKNLKLKWGVGKGTIHAGDFLRRFCSHLGMTNQAMKAAQEAVKRSEELDIRRSPVSVAAAIIYMIAQLSEVKSPIKEISGVTGVAEGTIRNSYKDLYPFVQTLIPTSFANLQDLSRLYIP